MAIGCRNYWDSVIEFNDNIVQELRFWYFHAESIDFRCVTPFYRKFEHIIFSDASEYAGAGFALENNNVVHFMWEMENRTKSTTWRELLRATNPNLCVVFLCAHMS